MKPIKIWLIGLCLMLGFGTCKKDCKNPCLKYQNLSNDFIIQPSHLYKFNQSMGTKYSTDTLFLSYDNYFESLRDFDEYKWIIPNDPSFVRTTKSFKMWFNNSVKFDLLLIGKTYPNECNNQTMQYDTIKHKIVVQKDLYTPLFTGNYIGRLKSNLNDTMHINIKFRDSFENDGGGLFTKYTYSLSGLYNKFSKDDRIRTIGGGYRSGEQMIEDVIDEKGNHYQIKDGIIVRDKNLLYFKYKVYEANSPNKSKGYYDELLIAEKIN